MIEKITKDQRQTYDNPASHVRAHEYEFDDAPINAGLIELSGRYPVEQWVKNTACTSLIYVINGGGRLMTPDVSTDFAAGDQLMIPQGQAYAFEANAEILFTATPAWTLDQVEAVEL